MGSREPGEALSRRASARALCGGVLAATMLVVALAPYAPAHEAPGDEIAELTRQIELRPGDASLYVRRADLHRVRREWAQALADLQAANRVEPSSTMPDVMTARVLLEADDPQAALPAVDRFLARDAGSAGGHLLRGRILARIGSPAEAAKEFTRGIDLARASGTSAQPDDYLDRARALTAAGPANVDEAIRGLDEGTAQLGGAIALQLAAIDFEVTRRHWDAALERIAPLEARAARKEGWIERRAGILLLAGRNAEAAQACRAAQAAIDALPERLRTTRAMHEMAARLRSHLSELDARATGSLAGLPTAAAPLPAVHTEKIR